jgi:hypothetical protein
MIFQIIYLFIWQTFFEACYQEEELWFELNFVSFSSELCRPLCFCASQLFHTICFLALLEQALAVSDINRWSQEWCQAMRSLNFFWFVCTRYLFWLFSQYKFEFQVFLKFCDTARSKFRSITKRLRDWEGSHEAHENVSSIHQQFKCISFCILGCYLSLPGTFLRSMLVPFNG